MLAFFTSRRKILLALLLVFLFLSATIITIRLSTASSIYMLIPDGIPFTIEGSTAHFQKPYQTDQVHINIAEYSHDFAFRPNLIYSRVTVLETRVLEMNLQRDTRTVPSHPYLIIKCRIDKLFYQPAPYTVSENDILYAYTYYFPSDTIESTTPKITASQCYYMALSPLSLSSSATSEELKILNKLANYAISPDIYMTIPISQNGTVIAHYDMVATSSISNGSYIKQSIHDAKLTNKLSTVSFEEIYQSLIAQYCNPLYGGITYD